MVAGIKKFLPYRLDQDAVLPPYLVLLAKTLCIVLWVKGYFQPPEVIVPFWDRLAYIDKDIWSFCLHFLAITGSFSILFNIRPRIGSGLISICLLISILICMPCYGDSGNFACCIFLLLALYNSHKWVVALRLQFAVLYFGAAINKLLSPDWISGQFMWHWNSEILRRPLYYWLITFLPEKMLNKGFSWLMIGCELFLPFGLIIYRWMLVGALVAISLHSGVYILFQGFDKFYSVLMCCFLVFLRPIPELSEYSGNSTPGQILSRIILFEQKFGMSLCNKANKIIPGRNTRFYGTSIHLLFSSSSFFWTIILLLVYPTAFADQWIKSVIMGMIFISVLILTGYSMRRDTR